MNFIIWVTFVVLTANFVNGAKILGIFHAPAYSHQQLGHRLLVELAKKGHEVTYLSPIQPKGDIKNFKKIDMDFNLSNEEQQINMFDQTKMSIFSKVLFLELMGIYFSDIFLNHTQVQELLKSDHKFDMIIMEQFLNEAFKGFCYHYNTHCVMLSTVGSSRWTNAQMGNPGPPSYVPDLLLSLPSKMNFWQRIYNTLVYFGAEMFSQLYTFPKHNQLIQKYFPGAPPLSELYCNSSLMLLNSDVSTNAPVPLVPNMINVGGYHVQPPEKLPEDLQEYLDNAKEGVIFFSMGSNLKSKDMPVEKRKEILKVFSKQKEKVLWKWEDETLPDQPPNVKLGKWLPQQSILAHPNVKVFITHGGLLSIIETIHHGVPIIGIPVYGDQEMNVANVEIGGFGIGIPFTDLSENTLENALNKILNNPKYRENAKRRSKIMHDQPMKPLDRAVFWVEYVLRHNGAPHLRTAALHLNWYQYLTLDVIAFLLVTVFAFIYSFCKFIKLVCCRRNKLDKHKKNN